MADNPDEHSDLKKLLSDSSRFTVDVATNLIDRNPEIFSKMLDFALLDLGAYSMRAARVVYFSSLRHPGLIRPYLPALVQKLSGMKNDGLKREMTKTIAVQPLQYDEETAGSLVDTCFAFMNSQQEKVAVKVYAMEILFKLSEIYPDLRQELICSIEYMMPEASAGMKSRGRKYLTKLKRATV